MTKHQSYIKAHRPLFWSVSDENLPNISDELLVETILNYGSLEDVRELIALLGLEGTAAIFLTLRKAANGTTISQKSLIISGFISTAMFPNILSEPQRELLTFVQSLHSQPHLFPPFFLR